MDFDIAPVSTRAEQALVDKVDNKTKPVGALGRLEALAVQLGRVQQTLTPRINHPTVAVFAADHGITAEPVSAYPAAVTAQMVYNFLAGGAAINVFAEQNGVELKIVDAGVDHDFGDAEGLLNAKIARGTANFLKQPAMSIEQCENAVMTGAMLASEWCGQGCNVIGFGEMGIGNTSAGAMLMSLYCALPLEQCVGSGAGLDNDGVSAKLGVLRAARDRLEALALGQEYLTPMEILRQFGGFEIAMICGGYLAAARAGALILVDGFIATSALLAASKINPRVLEYCVFSHCSEEHGHRAMLSHLNAEPLLDMGLRLGEGTGAALALPLVSAAANFLNAMSSFSDAGVSGPK